MFVHQHRLRHLLRPEHYYCPEHYQRELERLFRPAWHPLAARAELARPGDFLTFDLFGTPVLVRNCDGEVRAFLNVCPHRHARLTDQPRGHCDRLRCQYHGWEFAADGRTGRIPEAKAFRPWDRENARLKTFLVEWCGDILFVNLSDDPVPLRDWLGPAWEPWQDFREPYRYALTWEQDFPCNWKVVLENSLESYHIPLVHPHTFRDMPTEENSWHELTERYSSYKTIAPYDLPGRLTDWLVGRMGQQVTHEYWHRLVCPHTTSSSLDVTRLMMCVFPTGPTTCRYRSILFTLRGTRRGPLTWLAYRFLRAMAKWVSRRVFDEDAAIYPAVQMGLQASPHRGVIGVREERIYVFQKYVLQTCGLPVPDEADEPIAEPVPSVAAPA